MRLTPARAREILEASARARIVVVGDVMLDEFLFGQVDRISPEAPVPVVGFTRTEHRAGGAANVAHNVKAMGGDAMLVGLVGEDAAGHALVEEVEAAGIGAAGLVPDINRCTTRKLRIVTNRNQQVCRVDYERDDEPTGLVASALLERLEAAMQDAQVVVVSDYLKGVVTRDLMAHAVATGRSAGCPVIVDPKIPHLDRYAGASLITPNHHEAEIATHLRIRTTDEAREAARVFQRVAGCASVLITRGEHGMWLREGRLGPEGTPAPEAIEELELPALAREVADVTGAGDTVVATIALAMAAGASLAEAAALATHAAGVAVARFGPAAVTAADIMASVEGN